MPVIIPLCTSCKFFKEEKNEKGWFCCAAFPDGIPKEYFWCSIDVTKIEECAKGYKFIEDD